MTLPPRIVAVTVLEDLVEVGVLGVRPAEHLAYQARLAGLVVWQRQPHEPGDPVRYLLLGTGEATEPGVILHFLEQQGRMECRPG